MNKQTRATLAKLALQTGKIQDLIEELKQEIEEIKDSEEDKYSNMPESLQDGENGQKMQSAIDALDAVIDSLGSASDEISSATDSLNEVSEQ